MAIRAIFLTPNPIEAAGTRYRAQQYFPYLEENGIQCELAPFLTSGLFHDLYKPGGLAKKTIGLAKAALERLHTVIQSKHYDIVCISREAMLFGPPVIEWLLKYWGRRPIVFDFDDAIFVPYVSPTYGPIASWLKYPSKSEQILSMSKHILAGNNYLADYARLHNNSVTVLPTVVDTDQYSEKRLPVSPSDKPVIGWIGSHSTAQYLDLVFPALEELAKKHLFIFRVIGSDRDISIPGVEIDNRKWSLSTEVEDFQGLDIGIYPIRDDDWSRGKCAFKAIQYMASGVPCVASPVGMTTEVITNHVNGMLAGATQEWVMAIDELLVDTELRLELSAAGEKTIEEKYSLRVHAPRLVNVLLNVSGASPLSQIL